MENMLQSMMKHFRMVILMGFMIVAIALVLAAINSANAAGYYAVDKATRDASVQLAAVRAGIESTIVWLPYFKFLGVAMILTGIIFALGVIATNLQNLGKEVMASVPKKARITVPPRPKTVMLMRGSMMLGMLIIVVGLVISIQTAGIAASVFSNPITTIDAATAGSALLSNLAQVHATESWLEAFKFVGVAFYFLAIINGLATIIFALRYQWNAIPEVARNLQGVPVAAPASAD